jgi:hypothetical protein
MPSKSLKAKIVRVKLELGEAGLWFATSPDLKGLLVAERSREEAEEVVPVAIRDMYAACDLDVVVTRLDDDYGSFVPWVAFPAEIARKALCGAET